MTSTIKVNNVQNQCGANIINESSNTITIGASGDTVTLASGASQSGFGRSGSVDWQTGSIKTSTFTATSGEGYFVDTSSGAVTANLPAGTAGAIVAFSDYTRTFGNNNLTISPNGSNKIGGVSGDAKLKTNGQSATFVYVDGTEGWINVQETQTSQTGLTGFIMATGGTISCTGNCRVHTFTGPGTFCVANLACVAANNRVSYLVVAGGGGGGNGDNAGGGGAGGFRESQNPVSPYTTSPLVCAGAITVTATAFPITVGGGGAGGTGPGANGARGTSGSNSIFSTVTSAGGGGGGGARPATPDNGLSGGSGGGAGHQSTGGAGGGNSPPVSPPQGNNGGNGAGSSSPPAYGGGGGGGATAVGGTGSPSAAGAGGAGASTEISGSSVARGGGGGGGGEAVPQGGAGGTGGGGAGNSKPDSSGGDGTANTGGGGGSTGSGSPFIGGSGGSGVVIIRYKIA
jgi:hypothetical protein